MTTDDLKLVVERLCAVMPAARISHRRNPSPSGQDSLLVDRGDLLDVCRILRDDAELAFDMLSNVTGVDWIDPAKADAVAIASEDPAVFEAGASQGFLEVVYHFYSLTRRVGPLVLRVRTGDRDGDVTVPSIVGIFRSAEFQEREIYDLYGVKFTGHPDLRRILMWDEFVDHPMRKDYVAPDDHEYEPTPHDAVLVRSREHYPNRQA